MKQKQIETEVFTRDSLNWLDSDVCSAEKYTKRSSNTLLGLVYFSAEQTLHSDN